MLLSMQGRSSFVPSLGIDANALHAATVNKFTSISRCCQHCLPSSRVSQLIIIIDELSLHVDKVLCWWRSWLWTARYLAYWQKTVWVCSIHTLLVSLYHNTHSSSFLQIIQPCACTAHTSLEFQPVLIVAWEGENHCSVGGRELFSPSHATMRTGWKRERTVLSLPRYNENWLEFETTAHTLTTPFTVGSWDGGFPILLM